MLPKTKGVKPALPILHTDRELLVCEQHRREGKEPKVEKPTREKQDFSSSEAVHQSE